jgi:hypothetical protein
MDMNRRLLIASAVIASIATVAGLTLFPAHATPTQWEEKGGFSNRDLVGGYALQSTGTINYPSAIPLSKLNGPFANNGRVWCNGQGQMKLQIAYNFNGQIVRVESDGTYDVEKDGTFTASYVFQLDSLPPLTLSFDGVLAKNGKEARIMMTGHSIPGVTLPPGYIGHVVVSTLTKQ